MVKHLIIGGTGTLGTALVERLVARGEDVAVLSRGELAQKDMKAMFPTVQMIVGDVRDRDAVNFAVDGTGADVVFLLAAIKHVDIAESNPLEAIKSNVLGPVNVAEAAMRYNVKHVVFSNTDKAILPITTYGYTKALAQSYLLSQNGRTATRFSAFAWGNIVASRGSVIPTFVKMLRSGSVVPITHQSMSRFWLTIGAAADFMLGSYQDAPTNKAMIPPVKGASVIRVIESIARLLGVKDYVLGNTGLRGIEKIHEVLETGHDHCLRSDTCEQYTDSELDALLKGPIESLTHEEMRGVRAGSSSGKVRKISSVQMRN